MGKGNVGVREPARRSAPAWLLAVFAVLVMVSCRDDAPRSRWGSAASAWDVDPDPFPIQVPTCPQPGAAPDPLPADLPPGTTIEAGTLPGSFSVTPNGEATYTIPLPTLPGRGGIEPALSITYNSALSEGPLGVGFALSGLSSISRCPRTVAQDSEIAPVRDEPGDALCLDGQRLVAVDADATGLYPSEYRTFPDTFSKIVPDYAQGEGWDRDLGPKRIQVWTKDGLILEYGGSDSGQVLSRGGAIRSWLLTRMSDRFGNYLDVRYRNDLHPSDGYTVEHAPLRIEYTGHPQAAPSRAVEFVYSSGEERESRTLYARGMELRRSLRLDRIDMLGPGDKVARSVHLDYHHGPGTGRRVLDRVEECAEGQCKPATRFTWHSGGGAMFLQHSTPVEEPESELATLMLLDVTGDGLDDLVIPDVDMTNGTEDKLTNWMVAPNLSQEITPVFFDVPARGYQQPHAPPVQQSAIHPEHATPIDYNHDGRMDLFLHDIYGSANTWKVLLSDGDGTFTWHETGVQRRAPTGVPPFSPISAETSAHLADVDGDGMPDLIQCEFNQVNQSWTLHRWTPAGPGFEPTGSIIHELSPYPCNAELHAVDVDADGRVELVVQDLYVTSGNGTQLANYETLTYEIRDGSWTRAATGLPITEAGGRLLFLDVNGDALPDAVQTGFQEQQPRTSVNTGAGFAEAVSSLEMHVFGAEDFFRLAAVLDYNADGRQDVLLPMKGLTGTPQWVILQSTGSVGPGTFMIVDPGLPIGLTLLEDQDATLADARAPRVTDVDGDGVQDVLYLLNGHVQVFRNNLHQEDLLWSVIDGMNAHDAMDAGYNPNVRIAYDTLVDRGRTTEAFAEVPGIAIPEERTYLALDHASSSECAYPVRCVVGPRTVVSRYDLNNGADLPRQFQVAYRNGRYHRLGRGFLGFGARIVRDIGTGAGSADFYDNTTYDGGVRAFPFAGRVEATWRWSPSLRNELHPDPSAVELEYSRALQQVIATQAGSYYTLPLATHRTRQQGSFKPGAGMTLEEYVRATETAPATVMSDTWQVISDFDEHGNVLRESSSTDGVDLQSEIVRVFDNDVSTWRIGELRELTECSKALGIQQCRTTRRQYDARGRVWKEDVLGASGDAETEVHTWFQRDGFGNLEVTASRDGFGSRRAACTSYDAEGLFPFAHINPAGHLSYSRYDPALGALKSAVDPNGLVSRWAHDAFGRVTREIRPDGVETTITRTRTKDGGTWGNAWNVKITTATQGAGEETVQLDSLGRTVRRWWRAPAVSGAQAPKLSQEITYDGLGERIARRTLPRIDPAPPGSVELADEWEYDGMGRVLRHVSPWSAVTSYQYDGSEVLVTAPGDAVTRVWNDALGRPLTIRDPEGGVTLYTYGPFGGLWSVVDPDWAQTTTERDAYGRVRRRVDPDRGETITHYNGYGLMVSSTDAEQRQVEMAYDPLGRPVWRGDADGDTRWTWDTAPHGIGQLEGVEGPDGHRVSHAYDALGRPERTTLTIDGEDFGIGVAYDALGRVETIEYPDAGGAGGVGGFAVRRELDPYGRLRALNDPATGAEYWRATAIDEAGRITGEHFGGGVITSVRGFDAARQRVASIVTDAGPTKVQDLLYLWNNRVQLSRRRDMRLNQVERFEYDKLDRLTCVRFGLLSAGTCAKTLQYARNGNLSFRTGVGAYAYDPQQPHAVVDAGGASYGYDAVGNQRTRPGATISYTAFDLPREVVRDSGDTTTFEYDGAGQRVRKRTPTEEIVYVGDLYERATNVATGEVEHRYFVRSDERVVAMVTRKAGQAGQAKTQFVHVDHLGSADALTSVVSGVGGVDERRSYDELGGRRDVIWSAPVPAPGSLPPERSLGFTGHEPDAELGLVNMKGRMYDPKLGRFLTPDPVVAHPHFGQSWNPYSYVLNSPLSKVDPSGFQDQPPAGNDGSDGPRDLVITVRGDPPQRVVEGSREATQVGDVRPPADMNLLGLISSWIPQVPATLEEWLKPLAIAEQLRLGVHRGMQELVINTGKSLWLNFVTGGLYGVYSNGKAIYEGYKEGGALGALNAVNPLYHLARGVVDTVDALERGDYEAAGAIAAPTAVLGAALGVGVGRALAGSAAGSAAKDVVIPSRRFPETAAHIRDAQAAGHPSVLTIARGGADANRSAAQAGHASVLGKQLDEYPPAMFREGGAGASIRPVTPRDNMGAGACIGNQCRGLPDGARVRIVVE